MLRSPVARPDWLIDDWQARCCAGTMPLALLLLRPRRGHGARARAQAPVELCGRHAHRDSRARAIKTPRGGLLAVLLFCAGMGA